MQKQVVQEKSATFQKFAGCSLPLVVMATSSPLPPPAHLAACFWQQSCLAQNYKSGCI